MITKKKAIQKAGSLEAVEQEIFDSIDKRRESVFETGAGLARIKSEELWKQDGFKSWNDYCKSGRVVCSRQHADRFIAAHNISGYIADAPTGARWSERAVRELMKLMDPKTLPSVNNGVVARISKNVIKEVEGGEKLTAKLVKEVAKKDLYSNSNRAKKACAEQEKQRKQRQKDFDEEYGYKTMEEFIRKRAARLSVHMDEYKEFGDQFWDELSEHSCDWMIKTLTEMRDFFVSVKNQEGPAYDDPPPYDDPASDGNCTHGCNLLPQPTEVPA